MGEEQFDATAEEGIDLLEILQLLVKRKLLIILFCSLAAVVSAGYTLTLPNVYSATAKVFPPQKESSGGLSALLGQAGGGLAGLAGGLSGGTDLFIGILKSRTVADAVIQRLDLVKAYRVGSVETARQIVDGALKAQSGTDGIIAITAEDTDPGRAAQLANAFAAELGRETVRLNLTKVGNEKLFLEKRLDVVKRELAAAEEDMKQFSLKNKIIQLDSQSKASFEGISKLKAEIANKEVQLSVLRISMTDGSQEVKALHAGIQRLRAELAGLEGHSGKAEGVPSLGSMPGLGLEYARKMRELKTREAVFEQLSKQYEVAKLNEAKDSSAFQIIDEAISSPVKVRPKRGRVVLLTTVVAFMAAVGVILMRERFDNMSEEDRKRFEKIKRELLSFR